MRGHPRFSRALTQAPASGIRRIVSAAQARQAAGLPVYPFHLGEPSFDTPLAVREAAARALMEGRTHYAPNAGIPELRQAIAADLSRRYGTNLPAESVVVTVGACEALTLALMAVLEPGDQVLVPTPCWPNYLHLPRLLGAEAVELPARPQDGFRPDLVELERSITPHTRAIVVNTPNNPTGAILRRDDLDDLLGLARRRGLWLICDEIYQDITFGPSRHVGVLELSAPDDPAILVGGFSKSYAMTGWRLGYLVASLEHSAQFLKLHQYLVTSATAFAQWGALEALSAEAEVEAMRQTYQARRDRVVETLRRCGIEFVQPEGAFYAFGRVPTAEGGEAFCERMLREHGLGFVPGGVFGRDFGDWFRLCFAGPTEELEEGLAALREAFKVPR